VFAAVAEHGRLGLLALLGIDSGSAFFMAKESPKDISKWKKKD
jgi:hypothetical protein